MRVVALSAMLMLLTLTVFFTGCDHRERSASGPTEKVTLAIAAIPDCALALIAQARGYFHEEGVEVEVHPYRYGKPALQEVLDGKADVATAAETPVMFAVVNGRKISILASIMTTSLTQAVVARKDRGIADFADLRGKRIAATLGTTTEYYLHSLLVTHGLSPKEVKVVDLKPEAVPDALARGDIDAAASFLPYSVLAQNRLGANAKILRDPNIYRESFVVASTPDYVRGHPGTVKKLLKALLKAEDFVRGNPEEARRIVAETTALPPAIIRQYWDDSNFTVSLDQTLMLSLEDESAWAIRNQLTTATAVPNYLESIYLDGLQSLKPEAVRILR
ncbi:NrtA/SsuA/CpmA family ABC transporter substrate-binding protein [Geomonas sp.]|uniref:ABC transporter substrate-binding protein n=1 Tax=Geomonas sp. TaxID=2651584 RepID=UPI002B49539C|nr:NrtA/SsuA/CpmA family ABC transporter substrate-binding protein [Geomonas sp.]HJV36450.1 NrtA/SsuA/CpmA family ABC transporter substrate-binding protein [Geomonas sp.]